METNGAISTLLWGGLWGDIAGIPVGSLVNLYIAVMIQGADMIALELPLPLALQYPPEQRVMEQTKPMWGKVVGECN